VSDVFSNHLAIPPQLLTQEYFRQIKKGLRGQGIAILNILARPTLEDPYSWRIDNTIRSVFHHCMAIPLQYSQEVSNIIYVCKITENKPQSKHALYLDDLNKAAFDFFNSMANKNGS
jgi:spermidine synthase